MALFESRPDLVWLEENRIINDWNTTIMRAGGHEEKLLAEIEQAVRSENLSGVAVAKKEVGVGMTNGTRKTHGRPSLFIKGGEGSQLNGYEIFIGAHTYGKHLVVSWYFTRTPKADPHITLFDIEEFSAYASIIHHDVLEAVKKLMGELDQNFAEVDTKSRGILNIS